MTKTLKDFNLFWRINYSGNAWFIDHISHYGTPNNCIYLDKFEFTLSAEFQDERKKFQNILTAKEWVERKVLSYYEKNRQD